MGALANGPQSANLRGYGGPAVAAGRAASDRRGLSMSTIGLAYLIIFMGFITTFCGLFGVLLLLFEEVTDTGRQHDRDGNGEPHDRSGGQEIKIRTLKPPHASRHDRSYGQRAPSNGKSENSCQLEENPTQRPEWLGLFLKFSFTA
jgi:hypothetical protein